MAGMLIAVNDQPLTSRTAAGGDRPSGWLMSNPDNFARSRRAKKKTTDRSLRIVKALPDAFNYEYAGTENRRSGIRQEATNW